MVLPGINSVKPPNSGGVAVSGASFLFPPCYVSVLSSSHATALLSSYLVSRLSMSIRVQPHAYIVRVKTMVRVVLEQQCSRLLARCRRLVFANGTTQVRDCALDHCPQMAESMQCTAKHQIMLAGPRCCLTRTSRYTRYQHPLRPCDTAAANCRDG